MCQFLTGPGITQLLTGRDYPSHAAITPARPDVVQAMASWCTEAPGKPSSIYSCGQVAKRTIAEVRARVGESIGARCEGFASKSGGTEAHDCALKGHIYDRNTHRNTGSVFRFPD